MEIKMKSIYEHDITLSFLKKPENLPYSEHFILRNLLLIIINWKSLHQNKTQIQPTKFTFQANRVNQAEIFA